MAVVAGFLILRSINDDDDGDAGEAPTGDRSTDGSAAVTTDRRRHDGCRARRRPPQPPLVLDPAVTVVVANASNVNGSAAQMSRALGVVGYTMGEPTNKAASVGQLDATVVYFDPAVPERRSGRRLRRPVARAASIRSLPVADPGADRVGRDRRRRGARDARHRQGRQDARRADRGGDADTTATGETVTAGGRRHHGVDDRTLTRASSTRRDRGSSLRRLASGRSSSACRGLLDAPQRLAFGALEPEPFDERGRRDAPARVVVGVTDDRVHGHAGLGGVGGDAADHLALEALLVEVALAGDDEVGAVEPVGEVDLVGDQFEPGYQPAAERRQRPGQPACGAAPRDRRDVDAVLLAVHLMRAVRGGRVEQRDLRPAWRPSAGRTPRRRRRTRS